MARGVSVALIHFACPASTDSKTGMTTSASAKQYGVPVKECDILLPSTESPNAQPPYYMYRNPRDDNPSDDDVQIVHGIEIRDVDTEMADYFEQGHNGEEDVEIGIDVEMVDGLKEREIRDSPPTSPKT